MVTQQIAVTFGSAIVFMAGLLFSRRVWIAIPTHQNFWKAIFRQWPAWLKAIVFGAVSYYILIFVLFNMGKINAPTADIANVLMFSLNGLTMYTQAIALFFTAAYIKAPKPLLCGNGHPVKPGAKFCETCGINVLPPQP